MRDANSNRPPRHLLETLRQPCRPISRRGLITGLASLLAAPAIVRATSIMPVKAYALPRRPPLMGNLRGGFGHFHFRSSCLIPLDVNVGHWQKNEVHAFYRAELVEEFRRKYSLLQRRAFASIS